MSRPAVNYPLEPLKVSTELFTLTYGSLVAQLLKDYERDEEVNARLEKMGFNIGCRLVEDFLVTSGIATCSDFKETADIIAKLGFKMFLGIQPMVTLWSADNREFSLVVEETPFTDYVELPPEHKGLVYCNLLCGVIRGALEMVQMKTDVTVVRDILKGDDVNEIRVKLIDLMDDTHTE